MAETKLASGRAQPDLYCVIGNPIEHSRSPQIHTVFANAHDQAMQYSRLLAPLDSFAASVRQFIARGGLGMNVTVPFKEQAFALADFRTDRVELAGAANTLSFRAEGIYADNTDGAGLVRDLTMRHAIDLRGTSIVLLGAGGAARGVLQPLMQAGVASVLVANRTHQKALALTDLFSDHARRSGVDLRSCPMSDLSGAVADLVQPVWINATAAGLAQGQSPVEQELLTGALMAYDMMYASQPTAFMAAASAAGCQRVVDGLGMLVEQAAESFLVWRGVRPLTDPVYQQLR